MFDDAPCLGATPLFFAEDTADEETPPVCLTCPHALPCLEQGWSESFGVWGSFTTEERVTARIRKQTPEELWSTRFS